MREKKMAARLEISSTIFLPRHRVTADMEERQTETEIEEGITREIIVWPLETRGWQKETQGWTPRVNQSGCRRAGSWTSMPIQPNLCFSFLSFFFLFFSSTTGADNSSSPGMNDSSRRGGTVTRETTSTRQHSARRILGLWVIRVSSFESFPPSPRLLVPLCTINISPAFRPPRTAFRFTPTRMLKHRILPPALSNRSRRNV